MEYDDKWFRVNGYFVVCDNDKSNRYIPTLLVKPKFRKMVSVLYKKTIKINSDNGTITHSLITEEMISDYLNDTSIIRRTKKGT